MKIQPHDFLLNHIYGIIFKNSKQRVYYAS